MIHPSMAAKAHALIAADAEAEHRAQGCCYPGARRKRHRPYSLTPRASAMVAALGSGSADRVATLLHGWHCYSPAG